MAWATENLIGALNQTSFTLSHTPQPETMVMYIPGKPIEKVANQPTGLQFSVSGNVITLGIAPASEAGRPFCRYWWVT